MKIALLTSAHPQEDIRIFYKQGVSLAAAGYETYQISCGTTYEKYGLHLIGIGEPGKTRMDRMIKTARKVYQAAAELDADVYHLHDPELLPYGRKLKKAGKIVVFDSHESISAQIMGKTWIPKMLRRIVSKAYKAYETSVVRKLDAVVAATPHIADSFQGRCKKVIVVNNYPKLDDIEFHPDSFEERRPVVCYAGGIDELRGEQIMLEAMKGIEGQLIIAGEHAPVELDQKIRYVGRLDRNGINALYGESVVGLCLLQPNENYIYSKPIKVYEYMAAGLPYICSDFPEWKKVAAQSGAGICVDPHSISAVRKAISLLLNNRKKGQAMGLKGREYIVNTCNWNIEKEKLLAMYSGFCQLVGERQKTE